MNAETLPGEHDYVVVGAGSAGCVLADRLSPDPAARALLLEAGSSDRHPHVLAPADFLTTLQNPRFNWCFETESGPGVDGRAIFFPRGKALGGYSSINGSLWVRGQARRATSTPGRSGATPAGPGPTCCPPSAASRTTPSAPAAWAPIRWPWWTCGCAAWAACAWRTPR